MTTEQYKCHVCGWHLAKPAWGEDGKTPSWLICACCGCEFGYDDIDEKYIEYNTKWLQRGAAWFNPEMKPENWDLEYQLARTPAPPIGTSKNKANSTYPKTVTFKYPKWLIGFIALGFGLMLWGGISLFPSTLSFALDLLAALFLLGLLDCVITRIQLSNDTLMIRTLLKRHIIEKSSIAKAYWTKGCPAMIVLASGQELVLPPVGDSLYITNSIRTWLKIS